MVAIRCGILAVACAAALLACTAAPATNPAPRTAAQVIGAGDPSW